MDEVETLSLSTAVMMALGLIVNLLLLPFPFVWPYRVAKARRRFPERGKFCLLSGLISYVLVALAMGLTILLAIGLHAVGLLGDQPISPGGVFFSFGWLILALSMAVISLWVSGYVAERWRDWVDRYLR